MDYLNIVIQGFTNDNHREFLKKYFIREFKKAEKEQFFESDEFFNGCLKIIKYWDKHVQEQVFKRKQELYFMLNEAKNKTINDPSKEEGKSYEQETQKTIDYCELELKKININDYLAPLHSLTRGRVFYNMPYTELSQIKDAISEASKKILENNKSLPPQKESGEPNKNLHNGYFKGNTFLLFEKYCKSQVIDNTSRTDLSVLYQLFCKNGYFVDTMELKHYLKFLLEYLEYGESELKNVDLNTKPNIIRKNKFTDLKDNLKLTLE